MNGTEKQTKWAEQIKTKMIQRIDEEVESVVKSISRLEKKGTELSQKILVDKKIELKALNQNKKVILSIDDAVWFIENKHIDYSIVITAGFSKANIL